MIVTCRDTKCQHYNSDGCTAPAVHHTGDRFCVTGRRKQPKNCTDLMLASELPGYKKWKMGKKLINGLHADF